MKRLGNICDADQGPQAPAPKRVSQNFALTSHQILNKMELQT